MPVLAEFEYCQNVILYGENLGVFAQGKGVDSLGLDYDSEYEDLDRDGQKVVERVLHGELAGVLIESKEKVLYFQYTPGPFYRGAKPGYTIYKFAMPLSHQGKKMTLANSVAYFSIVGLLLVGSLSLVKFWGMSQRIDDIESKISKLETNLKSVERDRKDYGNLQRIEDDKKEGQKASGN